MLMMYVVNRSNTISRVNANVDRESSYFKSICSPGQRWHLQRGQRHSLCQRTIGCLRFRISNSHLWVTRERVATQNKTSLFASLVLQITTLNPRRFGQGSFLFRPDNITPPPKNWNTDSPDPCISISPSLMSLVSRCCSNVFDTHDVLWTSPHPLMKD